MFDIARHVSWTTLESAIEQGLRREQFTIADLVEVGLMLCKRGRPGSALFAAVLRSRPAWRRPVDSHPELVLLKALRSVGLELETQVALTLPDGSTIHPDLGHRECGFFIEIDDHEWHGGRLDSSYDDRRDRQVRLAGARVERVSTAELRPIRPGLVAELAQAHRQQHDLHVLRHLTGAQSR